MNVNWPKFHHDLTLKTCVGNDLGSLLAQRLPGITLIPNTSFTEDFGDLEPRPILSKVLVINRPVRLNYQTDRNEPDLELPTSRYVELRSISDKIHTIVAAPQLRYLDLDGAFHLIDQLENQAKTSHWISRQQLWARKNLRKVLEREPGSFYTRYFEFGKGEETLTLSLRRVERPSLMPWQSPRDGYLVNLTWNNLALEERLRKSVRSESDDYILALHPIEVDSEMEYQETANVAGIRYVG